MPEIAIAVNNKIPSSEVRKIVCDNTDYTLRFTFDGQWEDGPKTVYFVLQGVGALAPAVTDGDVCTVPPIRLSDGVSRQLAVGVQQGQVKTSAVVNFWCYPSAEDALIRGIVEDEDVSMTWLEWVNQNMAQAAENVRTAQEVLAEARTAAESASENAESAAENAESAAVDAAAARISEQNAEASARSASESAEGIEAYARAAEAAKTAAQTAASSASASAGSAETAKTEAQTAKTDAQTAKTAAETARTGAETAQSAAEEAAASAGEASALIAQIAAPPVKASASGNPVVIEDAAAGRRFASVTADLEPIQSGSGDPSPDNVRPITGWTGAKVTRCGKNLLDYETAMSAAGFVKQGDEWFARQSSIVSEKLLWKNTSGISGSITLTYSYRYNTTPAQGVRFVFLYSDGTRIENYAPASTTYMTKVITSDAQKTLSKIQFNYGTGSVSTWIKDMQIELGSASTEHEPYTGDTYEVTFPSEAGTVYGGTLDVTAGTLTVDRVYRVFDGSESWTKFGSGDTTYFRLPIGSRGAVVDDSGICSHFAPVMVSSSSTAVGQRVVNSAATNNATLCIRPENAASATDDSFTAWLAAEASAGHPVQIAYRLTEPAVYPLTPVQIAALEGINTIWADCGPVSVEYIRDTGAVIEAASADTRAMIGEASGVTASRSLAVGEYVTVGAALYRVTAAVGAGETLVPGINVAETTVGAELTRLAGMINQ